MAWKDAVSQALDGPAAQASTEQASKEQT
jgi:hypothetical protein